jgi:hypothetical protein
VLGAEKTGLNFSGNYTFVNERDRAVKDLRVLKI